MTWRGQPYVEPSYWYDLLALPFAIWEIICGIFAAIESLFAP